MTKAIAVVGAGVCGAVCARQLALQGHSVRVFDKGRGPGGRVSSRRKNSGHRFEHGASRIDVSQPAPHELLESAALAGLMHRVDDAYTSPSGLNALCKWLLDGLPAQFSTKIIRLEHVPDHSIVDRQILRRSMSNSVGDALVIQASED